MVRQLSQAPECFLLDCCIFIGGFMLLNCYSSSKTRIYLVKSYQINKSFCSITRCALLHLVYHLIAISMCFWCLELQVCLLSLLCSSFSRPNLNLNRHLNRIFSFSIVVCLRISVCNITVLTFQTCKSMQVPFNV